MDSSNIALIAIILVLVALSAFFSATETAYSALSRIRLKSRAEEGDARAAQALALAEDYDRLLSTILIGNNIVNITAASLGTVLFTRFFHTYGPTISTIVLTVVILIFAEISPKSLAKEQPESFAIAVLPAVRVALVILAPLNALFSLWKKLLSLVFHAENDEGITEEELITMVSEAEEDGNLEEHESQLIRAAIEFNDLEVQEILVPRVDIVAAPDSVSMDELASLFAESGYSRLPIYHETIDNITGVVHEKDLYVARYHGLSNLAGVVAPVLYTTPTAKISHVLQMLQRQKAHMVIVVDEYGGTAGLVTLEDILEELVGEIWDEHDEVIEEFRRQEDGSFLISCSANLNDLFELFAIRGDCDSATVSGWVLEQIGRLPAPGDHFVYENLDVTVTSVQHRRVLEIRVKVLPQTAEDA